MTSSMQWSSHYSIYQWIDSLISSHATSESALMTCLIVSLLQRQITIDLLIKSINEWNKSYYIVNLNQKWVCFNDMINAMIYLLTSLYLSMNQSISSFCSTSESALMTSSMQWFSHHSIYQWIDLSISSHAISDSASMTSFVNTMIYLFTSFYLSVNQSVDSFVCN